MTIEDNVIQGGAGSYVNEIPHELKIQTPVLNLGLPDKFQDHGTREQLLEEAGLTAEEILKRIETFTQKKQSSQVYSL